MPSLQTQFTTAARNQCAVLASLKAAPLSELKRHFERVVTANSTPKEMKQIVDGLLNSKDLTTRKSRLAELLYFRQGRLNLVKQDFNSLTRLQMEHEALTSGLVTMNQLLTLTDWELRLQLAAQVYYPAPVPFLFEPNYDSGYASGGSEKDFSSSSTDLASETTEYSSRVDGDDDGKKECCVTTVNQKTGTWTTFRY